MLDKVSDSAFFSTSYWFCSSKFENQKNAKVKCSMWVYRHLSRKKVRLNHCYTAQRHLSVSNWKSYECVGDRNIEKYPEPGRLGRYSGCLFWSGKSQVLETERQRPTTNETWRASCIPASSQKSPVELSRSRRFRADIARSLFAYGQRKNENQIGKRAV